MGSLLGRPLPAPFEFDRQLFAELLAACFDALEKRLRPVLEREMPRPWPLHLMHIEHGLEGRETLVLHDGRRIVLVAGVVHWHYATGALRPAGMR